MGTDKRTAEQRVGLRKLTTELRTRPRASLVAATGFGKTWILVETVRAYDKVVILAPNSKVIRQLASAIASQGLAHSVGVVCSSELGYEAIEFCTLSKPDDQPAMIRSFLEQSGKAVLLAMYQSQNKLIQACAGMTLDLIVCDEAHRTAGSMTKKWSRCLDDNHLRARKRAFFTATAKSFSDHVKSNEAVYSQDDERQYGRIVHAVSMRKAREIGAVNDYVVKVLVDDESIIPADERRLPRSVSRELAEKFPNRKPTDYEIAMIASGLRRAWLDGGRKVLAYTNRVDDAKFFAALIPAVGKMLRKHNATFPEMVHYDEANAGADPNQNVFCLTGALKVRTQDAVLQRFARRRGLAVIVSCRTLVEGVDLRSADTSLILARRDSAIDLAQIIGRVVRKQDGKATSQIFLPIIAESMQEFEHKADFARLRSILESLAAHDDSWKVELHALLDIKTYGTERTQISPRLEMLFPPKRVGTIARAVRPEVWETNREAVYRRKCALIERDAPKHQWDASTISALKRESARALGLSA